MDIKNKVLGLNKKGLKTKEISQKINVQYSLVRNIIKQEQRRIDRFRNPQKYRNSANRRYPRYAEKAKAKSNERYNLKKDEILQGYKEDRKKNPEKYRLKRQREKAKDPERYNRKKRENWKKNFQKNRTKVNKKHQEANKVKKEIVLKHYSKGKLCCNCCGVTGFEFLTIDHIIPKREMEKIPEMIKIGYKASRKASTLAQWLITQNFPEGFQILCWNCNAAKGFLGRCPHQQSK